MNFVSYAACCLALCAAFGAAAQKVYRCGPDGRTYQQTACADGKAVEAGDPRTAEQRQAAQAVAKSESKAATQLDRDLATAASPVKGSKAKPASAPAAKDKAASGAKATSKKAEAAAKPLVFLVPLPKGAASAPKK